MQYESTQKSKLCLRQQIFAGILFIGGFPFPPQSVELTQSVEFWSATDPEKGSCVLNNYPRQMNQGPTVNLVNGSLVACYFHTCEIYKEGGSWEHLQNTTVMRGYHSSTTREDAVLLIGGGASTTTEWIPVNGSAAQQGPFTVRHGWFHCTIKISEDVIVVTGGVNALDRVTEYQLELADGKETPLPSMRQPRLHHACGVYRDADNQQVSKMFCSIVSFKLSITLLKYRGLEV